ncbi:hypothetical protein PLANPX_0857 [Lacipirellula parvula]|uniref:Uncharacterized protein n=1 Tax=Lacipirellula parvula TaxID=2650471 RepID=A0A5K7X4D4_9BACT|nr:hypothetical protein PLANPX_0857 [Lacipirellula parvula]
MNAFVSIARSPSSAHQISKRRHQDFVKKAIESGQIGRS